MDPQSFGGWDAYGDAVVDVQLGDRVITVGAEGVVDGAPWRPSVPAYVITACNPGRHATTEENEAAQNRLIRLLSERGIPWLSAVGRSRDRSWSEPSVVVEISEADALLIGATFEQDAVFKWDGSVLEVIACREK